MINQQWPLHYHFYNHIWPIVLLRNRPAVRTHPAQAIMLHMSQSPGLGQLYRSYITREQGHGMCVAVAEAESGVLLTCRDLYCIWIERIIWVNNESVLSRVNSHISILIPFYRRATIFLQSLNTGNPPYLASLLFWHTTSRTLQSTWPNLLSVSRCNLSFGIRDFCTTAPAIWNRLPANIRSCVTLSTFCRHLKSHLFQSSFPTA